jgi:hypothetical protein
MTFGLVNVWMLLGLCGLAVPPVIHLLNRRRYRVVDWGAMQFLEVSQTTRRRLFLDELLLMLVRMGILAAVVLALAGPQLASPLPAGVTGRPPRAIVVLIDGSASMACGDPARPTPHEAARARVRLLLDELQPGDSVALLQVQAQVVPVVEPLSRDLGYVRRRLDELPAPAGGCRWPDAVRHAQELLQKSTTARRDILILTDGQRHGWADADTLAHWEKLAPQLAAAQVTVVNVAADRPAAPPNYALAPLRATPAVVWPGREITFQTTLTVTGPHGYRPPKRIRLEIDGRPVRDLTPPQADAVQGQVPLTFSERFASVGSHLVTVVVDPGDGAPDWLPLDNRQDAAVEVVEALPVLLVEAEAEPSPRGSTFYWHRALAELRDPKRPSPVLPRVVSAAQFTADMLTRPLDDTRPGSLPRVLVLADVPLLSDAQRAAVERFLQDGGGVLVVLGPRVEEQRAFYNSELYRGGQGWLPARLDRVAGERTRPELAATVATASFQHPALALFRALPQGDLDDARFRCWWRVQPGGGGAAVARLSGGDPLLVEKGYKNGRVLLLSVATDAGWDGNLPKLSAFSVLAHELLFYLADVREAQPAVAAGQPLRFRLDGVPFTPPTLRRPGEAKAGEVEAVLEGRFAAAGVPAGEVVVALERPGQPPQTLLRKTVSHAGTSTALTVRLPVALDPDERHPVALRAWSAGDPDRMLKLESLNLFVEDAHAPGVYTWVGGDGRTVYAVVPTDPRELDLTACSDGDRRRVADLVPVRYDDALPQPDGFAESGRMLDLWWLCLLGVLLLLCGELWLTRRLALAREATP